jgi:hypothetical protein
LLLSFALAGVGSVVFSAFFYRVSAFFYRVPWTGDAAAYVATHCIGSVLAGCFFENMQAAVKTRM